MGDIVATIQREQDEIIRSPLAGVLVVQGGPGTGKTAVALHRAAYLLYTHRFPLERQGVLVVGPNPLFLRYIEQVLPSLGETGVTLSTVSGLVPEVRVAAAGTAVRPPEGRRPDGPGGGPGRAHPPAPAARDVAVPFGATVLRLSVADSERVVATARRRPGTHNARRRFVEQQVVRRWPTGSGRPSAAGRRALTGWLEDGAEEESTRRTSPASSAGSPRWPRPWTGCGPASPPTSCCTTSTGPGPLVAAAGRGILTADEEALLDRPRSASLDDVAWTPADAALVDEARPLLGPRQGGAEDAIRRKKPRASRSCMTSSWRCPRGTRPRSVSVG